MCVRARAHENSKGEFKFASRILETRTESILRDIEPGLLRWIIDETINLQNSIRNNFVFNVTQQRGVTQIIKLFFESFLLKNIFTVTFT